MLKKTICMGAVFCLAMLAAGCTSGNKTVKLDPDNPTNIEVWHYYGGSQKNAFDDLVKEFNSTVGREEGIVVDGVNCGSVQELSNRVMDTALEKVGTSEMPSIFQGYANDVYEIDKMDLLVNLDEYFSEEEQKEYNQSYLEEGRMGDKNELKIFPIAKSTEIMLLNKTDWDKFSSAANVDISKLSTMEGLIEVAEAYYGWSGGKAFFGRDAMANYMLIGAKQLGSEIFQVDNGTLSLNLDEKIMKKLWDCFYIPYMKGYFTENGKFRSDDAKVGDILAFVGSTTSVTYFPKEVFTEDGSSYEIEAIPLKAPVFENAEKYAVQQGAGMAVAKSTPEKEFASVEFLKWFTQTERNLNFSVESGYLPVKNEAEDIKKLDEIISGLGTEMEPIVKQTLEDTFEMPKTYKFYTPKVFEGSSEARNILGNDLLDKAKEDREKLNQMVSSGKSREESLKEFDTQENFEAWLTKLKEDLNDIAN